jgi:hypothetical protein
MHYKAGYFRLTAKPDTKITGEENLYYSLRKTFVGLLPKTLRFQRVSWELVEKLLVGSERSICAPLSAVQLNMRAVNKHCSLICRVI